MNLDDETLLDAYLDGELDQAHRLAVEDALLATPGLARQLQELAQVRQWVVGLPRPTAPLDVSGPVLTRIAAQPPLWYRRLGWKRVATSRSFVLAASLTSAAAVLLSLTLARRPSVDQIKAKPVKQTVLVDARPIPPARLAPPESVALTKPTDSNDFPTIPSSPTELQPTSAVALNVEAERRHQADRERLAALLDRPDVQRVFVVVDSLDGPSRSQVEEALHRSPRRRRDYGRITLAQGLVVDPDRPGEAVVFAMTVDVNERTQLTDTLEQSIAGRVIVEPGSAPPPVVALLADTGQVDFLDEPVPVRPSEAELSGSADAAPTQVIEGRSGLNPPSDAPGRIPSAGPGVKSQETDRPPSGNRVRPGRGRRPPLRSNGSDVPPEPTTLLVWVTTRPPNSEPIP